MGAGQAGGPRPPQRRSHPPPYPPHALSRPPGGPKLRKWYGQEDGPGERAAGGGAPAEGAAGADGDGSARDVVLVTDGESAMGEQVALQLIVAR
jgi:hypothetical protein